MRCDNVPAFSINFDNVHGVKKNMTPLKSIALRKMADLSASPAAIALGLALAIAPTWARAETHVRGTPQAVVVEAQNATVEEILVALTDTFKVEFRSAANLDKRLTGTYEGTLQQAVSHILKGYDFVVKSGHAGLEITLLGAGKPLAVVGTRPATKSAEATAAVGPTPTATADNADHPVPVPSSGGPTPPIRVAQGPAPVPTPPAAGAAPSPVPQLGTGPAPSPMPPQPGAAPTPVPPMPTASSAVPPAPTGTPSTVAPPMPPAAPAPTSAPAAPAAAPPVRSPAR
jgi:hypothetical protein